MKTLIRIAALLVAGAFAQADIVIEQKMESSFLNGKMVMKIKGDQARMDMPGGPAGEMTVLVNSKTGEVTTLMHSQKMAMKMNVSEALKKAQEAGVDGSKYGKPKATGKKEKVGEWDAEIVEVDTGMGIAKMWVAKDFPNYKAIQEQSAKISKATSQGQFDPASLDLGGMVVKAEMTTQIGKVTQTLISAKEQPVDDKEFTAPEGYTEFKNPAAPK